MKMKLFVWIQGLKGPEPQLWDELQTRDNKPVKYLACYSVSDDRTLNQLKLDYPYVATSE